MAKIEYLKNAPGALRGAIRTVDHRSAKALVGLGYARYYKTRVVEPEPAPDPEPKTILGKEEVAETPEPKTILGKEEVAETPEPAPKKRQYKRRDQKAE